MQEPRTGEEAGKLGPDAPLKGAGRHPRRRPPTAILRNDDHKGWLGDQHSFLNALRADPSSLLLHFTNLETEAQGLE